MLQNWGIIPEAIDLLFNNYSIFFFKLRKIKMKAVVVVMKPRINVKALLCHSSLFKEGFSPQLNLSCDNGWRPTRAEAQRGEAPIIYWHGIPELMRKRCHVSSASSQKKGSQRSRNGDNWQLVRCKIFIETFAQPFCRRGPCPNVNKSQDLAHDRGSTLLYIDWEKFIMIRIYNST